MVHPRLRGELSINFVGHVTISGSSPLTRGTRCAPVSKRPQLRFIPAYAGNSCCPWIPGATGPVHPRLRGELTYSKMVCANSRGSSPLTRGTPRSTSERRPYRRFIPAYAGNSRLKTSILIVSPVHPRLRGELPDNVPGCFAVDGSSPLTRGTPYPCSLLPGRRAVHPRLRGELQINNKVTASLNGSSPLTRGTPAPKSGAAKIPRFIPAYAGNS